MGIDKRPMSQPIKMVSSSSSSASNDDNEPLYASECTRMCLRTPIITQNFLGVHAPRLKDCMAAMFSTSANNSVLLVKR